MAIGSVVVVNVLVALAQAISGGQIGTAMPVAGAAAGLAVVALLLWPGRPIARMALATALAALVELQIWLSGGGLAQHFNIFVSLSLLMAYRDWRPIAFMGSLFVGHHLLADCFLQPVMCLATPDAGPVLTHGAFIGAHALLSGCAAWVLERESRAARELEILINAMGRDGPIRLNLAVMRTESPLAQRLQHVQARMAEAMRAVQASSRQVEVAAHEVAAGSGELMARTEAAASGLRDSAMCLEQIGIIVQHSTEASTEAKAMSGTAAGMADQGDRLISDVVETMKAIESSSHRINDIIGVIDGIAFQTNILALNAAVEAARAGEQGRGFAVVASEVRSLAQRSAAAAKEIKSLIGVSTDTVESGTQLVSGAGQTMNQLVASVRRVGELFESVSADTSEQMQGLKTVSDSISELSGTTQQNVAVAERASAAAADLREQSARLAEVLASFNLGDVDVTAAAPVPHRATAVPRRVPSPVAPARAPRAAAPPPAPAASESGVVEFF